MMKIILLCFSMVFFIMPCCFAAKQDIFYERVASCTSMGPEWAAWIASAILSECEKNQVDPFLAFALFEQESNFNMSAYSPVGAIGITQLMPETAESLGVNPYEPAQNIRGGVQYLAYQLQQFAWAGELQNTYAVAAYNAGPGAVFQYGTVPPYVETYNHVTAIAENYKQLLEAYNLRT